MTGHLKLIAIPVLIYASDFHIHTTNVSDNMMRTTGTEA